MNNTIIWNTVRKGPEDEEGVAVVTTVRSVLCTDDQSSSSTPLDRAASATGAGAAAGAAACAATSQHENETINTSCSDHHAGLSKDDNNNDNGSDDDIVMPVFQFGYRTVPLTWDELHDIIYVKQQLELLTRNPQQQRQYEIFKQRQLRRFYASVDHYILITKFGLEQRVDPSTGLYVAYPSVEEYCAMTGGQQQRQVHKRLVKNDFPYCVASDVEHWILWKLGGTCTRQDVEGAKVELRAQLSDVTDQMDWITPVHLKSVPDIDHVHILCRRSGQAEPQSSA